MGSGSEQTTTPHRRFGRPIVDHVADAHSKIAKWWIFEAFVIAGFVFNFIWAKLGRIDPGPAVAVGAVVGVIGAGILVVLIVAMVKGPVITTVYERGISQRRRSGRVELADEDVVAVTYLRSVPIPPRGPFNHLNYLFFTLVLESRDPTGRVKPLVIHGERWLPSAEQPKPGSISLAQMHACRDRLCALVANDFRKRLKAGETVTVAGVMLTPDGLAKGNETVPWRNLGGVGAESLGVFVVRDVNGRAVAMFSEGAPNAFALWRLVSDVVNATAHRGDR
jgi:hypothetical protein